LTSKPTVSVLTKQTGSGLATCKKKPRSEQHPRGGNGLVRLRPGRPGHHPDPSGWTRDRFRLRCRRQRHVDHPAGSYGPWDGVRPGNLQAGFLAIRISIWRGNLEFTSLGACTTSCCGATEGHGSSSRTRIMGICTACLRKGPSASGTVSTPSAACPTTFTWLCRWGRCRFPDPYRTSRFAIPVGSTGGSGRLAIFSRAATRRFSWIATATCWSSFATSI